MSMEALWAAFLRYERSAIVTKICKNRLKHQRPQDRVLFDEKRKRHSVRAASRLSLKVLRFESDLYELNILSNEAWSWIFDGKGPKIQY